MKSLVITTPADDLTLLTIEEMRLAAGLADDDDSRDAELTALEAKVAASITSECNIAIGAGAEPTLRRETLTETFYFEGGMQLVLSRRHNIEITSVTVDGGEVDAANYLVNPETGFLTNLQNGYPYHWGGLPYVCYYGFGPTIVVVYDAGFDTVPADLKMAAADFFRSIAAGPRDSSVKSISEEVPGVMTRRTDYWVGSVPGEVAEGPVPDVVSGQLKRFRNSVVA